MKRCLVITAVLAAIAGSALPAFGADSGTVNMTITVASSCITLQSTTLSFPALPFSVPDPSSSRSGVASAGGSFGNITNCGGQTEKLYAHGTDAAGAGSSTAHWSLIGPAAFPASKNPCALSPSTDRYEVTATTSDPTTAAARGSVDLGSADQLLDTLGGGAAADGAAQIWMPCSGSSGGGETMSFQVIYTASF